MSKEIKNLSASLQARLVARAKREGQTPDQVFYYYALERFLYRLYQSPHGKSFVLKGGLMFFGWGLPLRRPTRDIDLQGYTINTIENLTAIIREVCQFPVEPADGMLYDLASIHGEDITNDADYHGVRISVQSQLGHIPIPLQVDVSFANQITPHAIAAEYFTLLGMPTFTVRGYPYEMTIAEKFQAMVVLDMVNDRLKDFYDLWLISRQFEIQGPVLVEAITNTFRARHTAIPNKIPTALTEGFAAEKQKGWAQPITDAPLR